MSDIEMFLKSGRYLPVCLRDFHAQKDVFKTIHTRIDPENESIKPVSWITGHCYVIDVFLWFMARRGWTLQRSRAKLDFRDLDEDIAERSEDEHRAFATLLKGD